MARMTELRALGLYSPEAAKDKIWKAAGSCDFSSQKTAKALGADYCTFIRTLRDLGLYDEFRTEWKACRKANREAGRASY